MCTKTASHPSEVLLCGGFYVLLCGGGNVLCINKSILNQCDVH